MAVTLRCDRCKTVRDTTAPIVQQWQVVSVHVTPDELSSTIYYICQLCVIDLASFFANEAPLPPQPERDDPGDPNT